MNIGKKQVKDREPIPDIKLGNHITIQNKRNATGQVAIEKLEDSESMDWNTIYIVGREGFRNEVFRKLEHADVNYMPGNIGNSITSDHDMYWLDKNTSLRTFKEAIGAKTIWKYRVKFYEGLEQFIASQDKDDSATAFTARDKELINEMRKA